MMVSVYVKVFIAFPESAIDPESPLTGFWASEHYSPTTPIINLNRMAMKSRAKAN